MDAPVFFFGFRISDFGFLSVDGDSLIGDGQAIVTVAERFLLGQSGREQIVAHPRELLRTQFETASQPLQVVADDNGDASTKQGEHLP